MGMSCRALKEASCNPTTKWWQISFFLLSIDPFIWKSWQSGCVRLNYNVQMDLMLWLIIVYCKWTDVPFYHTKGKQICFMQFNKVQLKVTSHLLFLQAANANSDQDKRSRFECWLIVVLLLPGYDGNVRVVSMNRMIKVNLMVSYIFIQTFNYQFLMCGSYWCWSFEPDVCVKCMMGTHCKRLQSK